MRRSVARSLSFVLAALLSSATGAGAGPGALHVESVPLRADAWELGGAAHRFELHRGREALFLERGRGWVRDAELRDGTIEFDISIRPGRGFSGVAFRGVDEGNFEHFYIRHHLSGMPDASQYQPVYHGVSGWQIYAGDGFTAPVDLVHGPWMHVRVDVNGHRAAVYVDSNEPVLVIDELQRDPAAGGVALNAGGAWFADLRITPGSPEIPEAAAATGSDADPDAPDQATPTEAIPHSNPVSRWRVSNPFSEQLVEAATTASAGALGITEWTSLDATHRDIANLARVTVPGEGADTVVAAVTLRAESEGVARLRFGFSDRVVVFLDGRRLYAGDDGYRTRDYRYLGTMGRFDEIALPLKPGDHELWFAVSEDFGGWGITAALVEAPGVTIVQ